VSPPTKWPTPDDGTPPDTVVLNLQKEYEKHKNIMLGMVAIKESYLDFDTSFQRLFGA
jgi:hypothetical protein